MRYTIHLKIKNRNYYQHWSSLINAPISYILNEEDWEKFYTTQYSFNDYQDWKLGNRKQGDFKAALKLYNQEHEKISKTDFIKRYKQNYNKDLLVIIRDYVTATKYIYQGKIYQALLTTYHKELKRKFVICYTDEKITYLDLNLFFKPSAIKKLTSNIQY